MEPIDLKLPKCAVLLAVYNGMQFLEEQISTILNQTAVDITLFINVDMSTDGSEQWLSDFARQEPRIVLLPFQQYFGGAGKNFFHLMKEVDFSDYDYVAFADQDDSWYPNKLSQATNVLRNSSYDAYSSNVIAFWPNGREVLVNKAQPQQQWDFIFEAAGPGCTYVMTVRLMTAIKEHMLNHWESLQAVTLHDWFCYAFARAHGYQWFIDAEPSMHYRQHESNQVGVNKGIKAYLNRFRQIKQGWWFAQIILIAQLIGINNTPFVKSWSQLRRRDFLRLACQTLSCRRERNARVFFVVICLFFAITGLD